MFWSIQSSVNYINRNRHFMLVFNISWICGFPNDHELSFITQVSFFFNFNDASIIIGCIFIDEKKFHCDLHLFFSHSHNIFLSFCIFKKSRDQRIIFFFFKNNRLFFSLTVKLIIIKISNNYNNYAKESYKILV